jgi:cytoskeletal protein CcmA (bactofilin family)
MRTFRSKAKNIVYIGEGVAIKGELHAPDTVVVHGAIDGEIVCHQLIVGTTGVVTGVVAVSEADVRGRMGSDISVENLMIVRASAQVEGDWTYGEIEVERGGVLMGSAEPTELPSERKRAVTDMKTTVAPYRKPELIVNGVRAPVVEEPSVASMAQPLRERRRM